MKMKNSSREHVFVWLYDFLWLRQGVKIKEGTKLKYSWRNITDVVSWDKSQYERAGWDQGHGRHPPGTVCSVHLSTLSCLDPVQSVTSSIQKQVLRQVKWPRMTDASSITHIVRPLHVTFPSLLMTRCVNNWVCSLFVISVQGLKDTRWLRNHLIRASGVSVHFIFMYSIVYMHTYAHTEHTERFRLYWHALHLKCIYEWSFFLNETNPPVVTF